MKSSLLILVCAVGVTGCSSRSDQAPSANSNTYTPSGNAYQSAENTPATQPDNTAINARDRDANAQTAGMQGESQGDINTTAQIRRRIMDQGMSVNAQNVKIVTVNGKVTLRGPVNSQAEKDTIGQIATQTAGGQDLVDNELDVQP